MTLITPEEAAEIARVHPKTVLRSAARGNFATYRVGARAVRIDRESYLEHLFGRDWRDVVGEEPAAEVAS